MLTPRVMRNAGLAAVMSLRTMVSSPAAAQTQQTFDACYVPTVGAIYLINQQGLPTQCLASSHVPISWSDAGVLADGSVTAVKLADGAVITVKLADGAVTEAKLGFDPATQAELDAVAAGLAAAGTINTSTNPMDWTQLKNVPAGFADGVDNSGGTPSDLACTGCVGTTDVADAAVTEAKLAFDPATQAELDAHAGSADHDGRYYTESELSDAGTINDTGNPVDWTKLKGVPAGFADGTDDGGVSDHGALSGLTDDDHPQYLLTNGARNATDGFAVTGTLGTGTIPATGQGTRLMWYPRNGAFRAGHVFGTEWDAANMGFSSGAIGQGATASGYASIATGISTSATGYSATAMGNSTMASGDSSTAMGARTVASGQVATAMGNATTASGTNSTAMGTQTTASAIGSTAMGGTTTASGNYATAMGAGTVASGNSATAMGVGTDALGEGSAAMGVQTTASGNYALAMGFVTTAQAYSSLVVGRYNVVAGTPTSWVATDPLFVVGNGSSDASRSNALTFLKNGYLGLGTSDPATRLDVIGLNNWDLNATEGDVRIGDGTYRLKISVALGGSNAGDTRIRAQGGTNWLILGSGNNDVAVADGSYGFHPWADNTFSLGRSIFRWTAVYAANGTIQTSDATLKRDIVPLRYGLDEVRRLRPITYRWKEGDDRVRLGLIAQEVREVVPELVHGSGGPNEPLGMNYGELVPLLINAIQEQQTEIAALRADLAALRGDVAGSRPTP